VLGSLGEATVARWGILVSRPTESSPLAIRASKLSRVFGDLKAVDGVDLAVQPGELLSLLGPNGAGKTTTIKMLCCLLRPTGGTASILGHDVVAEPIAVKQVIAVSPQETAIAGRLSAFENLMLMAGLHGIDKKTATARTDELLELMSLTARAKEQARKYSGGMKRRLSIAMALVSNPQVLFLDEPTLGLDPQARRAMWEYIDGLKGSTTIVLTTHYLEEADALADRIAIIDEGRIIALGTAGELKESISEASVTVVEAENLNDEAVGALRRMYPVVRVMENRLEIEGDEVSLYDIQDCLRPRGVIINSSHRKQVTLDDVFLHLTGRQLRE
jgi:ABC-2 type transport system ATP-binding protein